MHRLNLLLSATYSWRMYIVCFCLLAITVPAYFSKTHFLLNLEPYPDGLLYTETARNLILTGQQGLVYRDSFIPIWVPPLYSYILLPGYLISLHPNSFYIINILLLICTFLLFDRLLFVFTSKKWLHLAGLIVFAAHGYLIWQTLLPMTENAALPIFLIILIGLLHKTKLSPLLVSVGTVTLVLCRYSALSIAGSEVILLLTSMLPKLDTRNKIVKASAILLAVLAVFSFLYVTRSNYSIYRAIFSEPPPGEAYYGLSFFFRNLKAYVLSLSGISGVFLWKHTALSSFLVLIPGLWYVIDQIRQRSNKALVVAIIAGGVLLAPLIFYAVDDRYIILLIPLLVLSFIGFIDNTSEKHNTLSKVFVGITILSLFFIQRNVYKELIVANILDRSTAWQYQAIKHFDTSLSEGDYIITALPPHLVSAYQQRSYTVLPISNYQEFLQTGYEIWGPEPNYNDLKAGYNDMLEEGKTLYISNSYITHQQSVIKDYEDYKKLFNFELVSEGCLSACNIYRLSLKSTNE